MTDPGPDTEGQPGIASAALFGLCPKCGSRTLFGGVAQFAPRCRVCGLDFSSFNVGDGPAAFLTLIIGAPEPSVNSRLWHDMQRLAFTESW